jgi:hypothetical protein
MENGRTSLAILSRAPSRRLPILKDLSPDTIRLSGLSSPSFIGTSYRVHFTTSLGPDTTINSFVFSDLKRRRVVVKLSLIDLNAEMPTRRNPKRDRERLSEITPCARGDAIVRTHRNNNYERQAEMTCPGVKPSNKFVVFVRSTPQARSANKKQGA